MLCTFSHAVGELRQLLCILLPISENAFFKKLARLLNVRSRVLWCTVYNPFVLEIVSYDVTEKGK